MRQSTHDSSDVGVLGTERECPCTILPICLIKIGTEARTRSHGMIMCGGRRQMSTKAAPQGVDSSALSTTFLVDLHTIDLLNVSN